MTDDELTKLLDSSSLVMLLVPSSAPRKALDALADSQARLKAVALAEGPAVRRLKAFEAWLDRGGALGDHGVALADACAAAIPELSDLNVFGLPPSVKSSATSRRLVAVGKAALPALRRLLDDGRKGRYGGSEEATIASMYAYRVCDLGAALVARIVGVKYEDARDPKARDTQIAALRARLDAR